MKLFTDIVTLNPNLLGWCTPDKACRLAATVIALRPNITVEIGVFGGRSFIPMAMAHQHINHGMAFAIDPWDAGASAEGMAGAHLEWWTNTAKCDHEAIYHHFVMQLNESGAAAKAQVVRMKSRDVNPDTFEFIDLLHVDGNHGEEASCYDVKTFGSRVRVGGILVMDDMHWAEKATTMITELGFRELYRIEDCGFFQRLTNPPKIIEAL